MNTDVTNAFHPEGVVRHDYGKTQSITAILRGDKLETKSFNNPSGMWHMKVKNLSFMAQFMPLFGSGLCPAVEVRKLIKMKS